MLCLPNGERIIKKFPTLLCTVIFLTTEGMGSVDGSSATMCTHFVPSCFFVYLLNYVCIALLALDTGLLARSQYPEGPVTSHLDTGFSRFLCVYK